MSVGPPTQVLSAACDGDLFGKSAQACALDRPFRSGNPASNTGDFRGDKKDCNKLNANQLCARSSADRAPAS